jgi:ABC-type Zn2+ transport system substrate-binding protein/surface adhesin
LLLAKIANIAAMMSKKQYIASLLLAVYGVVFVHNIVPHHHHLDIVDNIAAAFAADDHSDMYHHHHHHDDDQHDHDHETDLVNHDHQSEPHESCHFNVQLNYSKISFAVIACVVNNLLEDIPTDKDQFEQKRYDVPQKLLEGYNSSGPLRAPPVCLS